MAASVLLWPVLALTRRWLSGRPIPGWRDMPERPPCPHCQYFGGEEHHPCCPIEVVRPMFGDDPDPPYQRCTVCGATAGKPCDGGLHG